MAEHPRTATTSRGLAENLRLLIGLRINRHWPYAANLVVYGPMAGHRRWRALKANSGS